MTREENGRGREVLRRATGSTSDCVPVERFSSLTPADRTHLTGCANCEAEYALWQQFEANEPGADEGAAVQWIAAELGRRRNPQAAPARAPRFGWFGGRAFAGLAAALIMMVAIGYSVIDREPAVTAPAHDINAYRGAAIRATTPIGDVTTSPESLRWTPLPGAARYDVALHEIDGTTIWTGSTTADTVTLPPSVSSQLAPGRSLTWEVTARDSSGAILATSGTQRFRVVPRS